MDQTDARNELIGLIYEAVLDRSVWPLVADRLADLIHAKVGQISCYDISTQTGLDVSPRVPPEALHSYADHWVHRNPLIARGQRKLVGEVFSLHDLMPKSEFVRTEIYNEFFAPLALEEGLGAALVTEGSFSASFGVWRPSQMEAFARSDADLLADLVPHLQRALQLTFRLSELETMRTASAELLNQLRQASLLVDRACVVQFANRAAEEILAEGGGLQRDAKGTLRAERQAETASLHKLIVEAGNLVSGHHESAGGRIRISRTKERAPLTVLIIPLRIEANWLLPRRPAAMLFVSDPERTSDPTAYCLRLEFGLTAAEAGVAKEILSGRGLKVAARRLGVSPTTVRTHLTAVFSKTGTQRQAELVRVLLQRGCQIGAGDGAGTPHQR
jgi:DNA-binding CsgD family transcriptional regulator